jgi:putative ABC transport system permease protein
VLRIALRMIAQRPAAVIATALALWIAVVIVTACGVLLESGVRYHGTVARYAAAPVLVATTSVQVVEGSGEDREAEGTPLATRGPLPAGLPDRIAALPQVRTAVVDAAVPAQVLRSREPVPVELHPWAAAALAPYRLVAGRAPAGPADVVADRRLGAVGERIALPGLGARTVTGTTGPTGATPTVFTAGLPGPAQVVGVLPRAGESVEAVAAAVRRVLPPADGAGAYPRAFTGPGRGSVESPAVDDGRELAIAVSSVFGGCALLIALLVIAGTVGLSVWQRHRDIALLRAIAATPRQVRRMVVRETASLGLLAGAAGVLPGLAAARWLRDQFADRGMVPADFALRVSWLPPVVAVAAALFIAVVAAWVGSMRSSRIRPSQALAETAVERGRPGLPRLLLGVTLCLVSARASGDDAAGIAVGTVFTLVVAVAFLAPVLIRLAAAVAGPLLRAFGAPGRLAAATTGASACRLAAVLSGLVLAVGLGGSLWFVPASQQHVAAAQTRAGLLADHVVTGPAPGLPPGVAAAVRATPGVSAATGLVRGAVFADAAGPVGYPAQGVDPAALPATLDLDVAAGRLAHLHGPAVAVDTLTADSLHLGVGDRFQGWYGDGTPADLHVVAVYRRGLGFAAMTLPRDRLAAHTAAGRDDAVLVRATPAGADAVRSALPPGAQLLPRSAYQVGLDRNLADNAWTQRMVTAVLVAYAVVAAVNALALYTAGRRRELALLRLAGATRSQVVRTVRLERVLLLGLALVLGGAVAAGTLVPMGRGSTGASVPYVPPAGWVAVLGGTVLLGLAGTTLPLRRILRTRPADAAGIRE